MGRSAPWGRPLDRPERPPPADRLAACLSSRRSERKKRRPAPSRFSALVAFSRFLAEASAPFEDFAAFAAALR